MKEQREGSGKDSKNREMRGTGSFTLPAVWHTMAPQEGRASRWTVASRAGASRWLSCCLMCVCAGGLSKTEKAGFLTLAGNRIARMCNLCCLPEPEDRWHAPISQSVLPEQITFLECVLVRSKTVRQVLRKTPVLYSSACSGIILTALLLRSHFPHVRMTW